MTTNVAWMDGFKRLTDLLLLSPGSCSNNVETDDLAGKQNSDVSYPNQCPEVSSHLYDLLIYNYNANIVD
jgi:hypothetical protein